MRQQTEDQFHPKDTSRGICHMYEILRVMAMAKPHPNALLIGKLWYRGEDSPKVEKRQPWKEMAAHTTSRRILHDAHSSSLRLMILHF